MLSKEQLNKQAYQIRQLEQDEVEWPIKVQRDIESWVASIEGMALGSVVADPQNEKCFFVLYFGDEDDDGVAFHVSFDPLFDNVVDIVNFKTTVVKEGVGKLFQTEGPFPVDTARRAVLMYLDQLIKEAPEEPVADKRLLQKLRDKDPIEGVSYSSDGIYLYYGEASREEVDLLVEDGEIIPIDTLEEDKHGTLCGYVVKIRDPESLSPIQEKILLGLDHVIELDCLDVRCEIYDLYSGDRYHLKKLEKLGLVQLDRRLVLLTREGQKLAKSLGPKSAADLCEHQKRLLLKIYESTSSDGRVEVGSEESSFVGGEYWNSYEHLDVLKGLGLINYSPPDDQDIAVFCSITDKGRLEARILLNKERTVLILDDKVANPVEFLEGQSLRVEHPAASGIGRDGVEQYRAAFYARDLAQALQIVAMNPRFDIWIVNGKALLDNVAGLYPHKLPNEVWSSTGPDSETQQLERLLRNQKITKEWKK